MLVSNGGLSNEECCGKNNKTAGPAAGNFALMFYDSKTAGAAAGADNFVHFYNYKAGIVYATAASGITADNAGKLNKYTQYQDQMSCVSKMADAAAGANNIAKIFWSTLSTASHGEYSSSQGAGNVYAKVTAKIPADNCGEIMQRKCKARKVSAMAAAETTTETTADRNVSNTAA